MKQKSQFNLKSITLAAYFATTLLFVAFTVYMTAFKNNTVYSDRNIASYETVNNYTEQEIKDESAPIGVRKEYRFEIGNMDNSKIA